MSTNSTKKLFPALLRALRPIARFLVRAGIGYREFSEIAKCAFVDVATTDYGIRGRPTNISRVAVMTGLTRKEVKRIRQKLETGDLADATKIVPAAHILDKWHTDTEFLDKNGKPRDLDFNDSESSFSDLVKRYGGDIPPGAMRTELKRVNAVEETRDGKLTILKRDFRPVERDEQLNRALSHGLYALATNIEHNLRECESVAQAKKEGWVEGVTFSTRVQNSDVPRVRRIASDRSGEFKENLDDLFSAYETIYSEKADPGNSTIVGVGIYYFEDNAADSPFEK